MRTINDMDTSSLSTGSIKNVSDKVGTGVVRQIQLKLSSNGSLVIEDKKKK